MRLSEIEMPEAFYQYFGFCNDKDFQNSLKLAGLSADKKSIFFLLGETGSGKNLFVKALYEFAGRRYNDLVDFTLSLLSTDLSDVIKRKGKKLESCLDNLFCDVKKYFDNYHKNKINLDFDRWMETVSEYVKKNFPKKLKELEIWKWAYTNLYSHIKRFNCDGERNDKGYEYINLGAWRNNPDLLLVELFGCIKGAYTGATQDRKGIFDRLVDTDGTNILFSDELGKAGIEIQTKYLDVIERWEFSPLGATEDQKKRKKFSGILVFAMNEDPYKSIKQGKLLEELCYRISDNIIEFPSMKEHLQHGDKVDEIIEYVCCEVHDDFYRNRGFCPTLGDRCEVLELPEPLRVGVPDVIEIAKTHISKPCLENLKERLETEDFQGNLRELSQNIRRLMNFSKENQIDVKSSFGEKNRKDTEISYLYDRKWREAKREFQKLYFEQLFASKGKYEDYANKSGVSKETLRKMKRFLKQN